LSELSKKGYVGAEVQLSSLTSAADGGERSKNYIRTFDNKNKVV
jgi:hypothetical protein